MNGGGSWRIAAEQRRVERPGEHVDVISSRVVYPNLEAIIILLGGEIAGEGQRFDSQESDDGSAQFGPLVSDEGTRLRGDRKSTRLNSSHANISYAVFCLKKKKNDK